MEVARSDEEVPSDVDDGADVERSEREESGRAVGSSDPQATAIDETTNAQTNISAKNQLECFMFASPWQLKIFPVPVRGALAFILDR